MRTIYFNFENKNPDDGGLVQTDLPFDKLTGYLAGLIILHDFDKASDMISKLPQAKKVNDGDLFDFAKFIFANDAKSEPVYISKELKTFDTGIRKSLTKCENRNVYVINLTRIVVTHAGGGNSNIFAKRVEKAEKRELSMI